MRTFPTAPDSSQHQVDLSELMARGPVVLDGAMGTELDARGVGTADRGA